MLSLGGFIENNTFETIRNGEFPEIPLMFSTCRDEGTAQAIAFHPNTTKETSLFIYRKFGYEKVFISQSNLKCCQN